MSLIASGIVVYVLACIATDILTKRTEAFMASWKDAAKPRWEGIPEQDKNHLAGNVSKLHASAFETPSPVRRPQPKRASDNVMPYVPMTYRDPDARPTRRDEDNGFGSYEQN